MRITTQARETQENLSTQLDNISVSGAVEIKRQRLLRILKYDGMRGRENMIATSHSETFQWIFPEEIQAWSSFVEWLHSAQSLYWISGKPGSGKSTLMKFIVNDKRTTENLKPNTLILSHYLWSIGTPMRKSTKRVILSLLYQLLLDECVLVTPGFWNPQLWIWQMQRVTGHFRNRGAAWAWHCLSVHFRD